MVKCNVCDRADNLAPHPFVVGAMICPDHAPKSTVSKAKRKSSEIVLDYDELVGLKAEGLIPVRTYIYLAMRIEGMTEAIQSLDVLKLCKKYGVSETDLIAAIASLSKKGIVKAQFEISAKAITHADRVAEMEAAFNAGN